MHDRFAQKNRKTDICSIFRFESWYRPLVVWWVEKLSDRKKCLRRLSDTCIVSPQSVSAPTWKGHAGRASACGPGYLRLKGVFQKVRFLIFDTWTLHLQPPHLGRSQTWAVLYNCTKTRAVSNSVQPNFSNFQLLQRPAPPRSQLLGREPKKQREG